MRTRWAVLAAILVLAPLPIWAVEPAGNWKVKIWQDGEFSTVWLLQIEGKDKQYKGKLLSAQNDKLQRISQLEGFAIEGDRLRFTIKVQGQPLQFEFNLKDQPGAKAGAIIPGSVDVGPRRDEIGPRRVVAHLEPTKLQSIDLYTLSKDAMDRGVTGPELFDAAVTLIRSAGEKKSGVKDVGGWAERAYSAAGAYGPAWKSSVAVSIAEALGGQKEYAPLAVVYAGEAEKLFGPREKSIVRRKVLTVLAEGLENSGKAKEAKEVRARLDKLGDLFTPEKYEGRKNAKANQVVLVELFTGAQCPPCVAADLAFDGLEKTYRPAEVVLLQYHLHIPGPDPLTNPDTESREEYYKEFVEGTPTVLFNGKPDAPGGGPRELAEDRYDAYRGAIEPLLEGTAPFQITAIASRRGNKVEVTAKATATAGAKLPEKSTLRLVLVEEVVNYKGGNGLPTHHRVVRSFLNGPKGTPLAGKNEMGQTTITDLDGLRGELKKYLDAFAKTNPFPNAQRPMEFANLRVVAFVQDDATRAVLQAVEVPVVAEGGK